MIKPNNCSLNDDGFRKFPMRKKRLFSNGEPLFFLYNENPRFERGFREAYSYESKRITLCYNGRRPASHSQNRKEKYEWTRIV